MYYLQDRTCRAIYYAINNQSRRVTQSSRQVDVQFNNDTQQHTTTRRPQPPWVTLCVTFYMGRPVGQEAGHMNRHMLNTFTVCVTACLDSEEIVSECVMWVRHCLYRGDKNRPTCVSAFTRDVKFYRFGAYSTSQIGSALSDTDADK